MNNYFLGAKLVRVPIWKKSGAALRGYPDPIFFIQARTDDAFNRALALHDNKQRVSVLCGSLQRIQQPIPRFADAKAWYKAQ